MSEAILTRSQHVLSMFTANSERILFGAFGEDESPFRVELEWDDWRDMGRPESITVTVEPGDHLNP